MPSAGAPGGLPWPAGGLPAPGSDEWLAAMLRNSIVSTSAATMFAMALFSIGRKRRDDEAAAMGAHPCDGSDAGDPHFDQDGLSAGGMDMSATFIPPEEAALPRWRRPSLMAARKATPVVTADEAVASRLTFGTSGSAADPQHEFRRLRYRMVRLSAGPDELRSAEIGRLDQGDEVELMESYGAYWKVRVPTGQIGWIHRMTLGDTLRPAAEHSGPSAFSRGMADGDDGVAAPFGARAGALAGSAYMARLAAAAAGASGDGSDYGPEGLAARLIRERQH
jgi:hypothetical protein